MLRIKVLRLSRGMSQWDLSQASGMSQGQYSMVERGLINPTDNERERLARVLSVPASTLFRSAIRLRRNTSEQLRTT